MCGISAEHGGQGSLRNSREDASHTSRRPPHDLGAFGNSNAQHMVHKASRFGNIWILKSASGTLLLAYVQSVKPSHDLSPLAPSGYK